MGNSKITNQQELMTRLAELKLEKSVQEGQLKQAYNEILATIDLVSIIKSITSPLKNDTLNFTKTAFTTVIDLIIGFVIGGKKGFKGFLNTLFAESIALLFTDNNLSKIITFMRNFFQRGMDDDFEDAPTNESSADLKDESASKERKD